MPLNCPDIQKQMTALKKLKDEFDAVYTNALSTKEPTDLNKAQSLKKQLEQEMKDLRDILPVVKEEHARDILEKEVFGKEAIYKAFGIELKEADIPPIPFTPQELERAKDMEQMLILRIDKTDDGKLMSLETMGSVIEKRWGQKRQGMFMYKHWKEHFGADYFTQVAPRSGWALVSKDILPNSTSKNYIKQIEVIIKALKESSFKDMELPTEYVEAIVAFESQKERLTRLMRKDWTTATKQLSELNINQLTRQSVQEVMYDLVIYFSVHGERLLPNKFTWSNSFSNNNIFSFGYFDRNGVSTGWWDTDDCRNDLGVSLSRRS